MEKKILISLLIASFVLFGMTGCQKEDSITKEPVQEEQIQGESKEELQKEQIPSTEENEEAADIQESSTLTCSSFILPSFFWFYIFFSGEGNDTPLQYSCLENPMDGGAW